MENQEAKEGEKGCCAKAKSCCGCKALAAVALLAVGGLGGFFCARHCCPVKTDAPVSAPAKP